MTDCKWTRAKPDAVRSLLRRSVEYRELAQRQRERTAEILDVVANGIIRDRPDLFDGPSAKLRGLGHTVPPSDSA